MNQRAARHAPADPSAYCPGAGGAVSGDGGTHARIAGLPCPAGELWDQALTYFRQAGEQAVARSAYQEAVAAFEETLGVVQHLPESRAILAQAIDIRLALHSALYLLGELERVFVNLQAAQALTATLGDPHRLGWVATYRCPFCGGMRTGPRHRVWPTCPDDCCGPGGCGHHGHGTDSAGESLPQPGETIVVRWIFTRRLWGISTAPWCTSTSVCLVLLLLPRTAISSPLSPNVAPLPRGGRVQRQGCSSPRPLITPTAVS